MEEGATSSRSSTRPPPARGILKNPLRRPSYRVDEEVAKTDEERQEPQEGRARTNEQYVNFRSSHILAMMKDWLVLMNSGLTWDEANLALTEIQKDSLMSVQLTRLEWKLTRIGRLMNPRPLMCGTMRRMISSLGVSSHMLLLRCIANDRCPRIRLASRSDSSKSHHPCFAEWQVSSNG